MTIKLTHKGRTVNLNHRLIVQKQLTDQDVEHIKELHRQRLGIEELMNTANDVGELGVLNDQWTEVQYRLQDAWKFEHNPDYVKFWEAPKCSCPVYDNEESLGTKYHIYSQDCLIHGWDLG